MMVKSINSNKIISFLMGAVILFAGFPAILTLPTGEADAVAATGTFTFSGNVSNGELVNITSGANVYRFEFNTTNNGTAINCLTANCIAVNLSAAVAPGVVTSLFAAQNLTTAINNNASTAALLTAANSTNLTTLTADTAGTSGNSITLADNAANIASSGMSGGTAEIALSTISSLITTVLMPLVFLFSGLFLMWNSIREFT